jgi:hypothetical protein
MKKFISSTVLGASLLLSAHSNAALLESTFTSDNEVTSFSYIVDGVQSFVDLSNVANLGNWQRSSSLSLSIEDGSSYQFIWDIENFGTLRSNNPVAFLGEFTFNGVTYLTDNLVWEVKSGATNNLWQVASLNVGGGSSANNQGSNIWGTRAPSDISSSAQWIWDGAASGTNDSMSFRVSIDSTSAVQASSPAVLGILGIGLVLVGFASRRK